MNSKFLLYFHLIKASVLIKDYSKGHQVYVELNQTKVKKRTEISNQDNSEELEEVFKRNKY